MARLGGLVLGAWAMVLGVALGAAPAEAHGQLVVQDSLPVEGARIGEPLDELTLVFTEAPAVFAYFTVTAPDGTRVDSGWTDGQPAPLSTPVEEFNRVDGQWVSVYYSTGFPAQVGVAHWPAAGDYTVTYSSVASDGEAVEGSYVFAYDGPVTQAPPGWTPPTDPPDPLLVEALEAGDPDGVTGDPDADGRDTGEVGGGEPSAGAGTVGDPRADDAEAAGAGPGVQPAVYVVVGLLVAGAVASVVAVTRRGRAGVGSGGGGGVAGGTGGAGRVPAPTGRRRPSS